METLGRQLGEIGHEIVSFPEQADVAVLNTCAVTGEAARKSHELARKLARANPSARLAVTGCYATLAPDDVSRLPNVELVVDNRRKDSLVELLQPWSAELDGEQWRRLTPEAPLHAPARTRAFVKVQDGCNNKCTFCIVTVVRGEERSRRVGDILAEIPAAGSRGLSRGSVDRRTPGRLRQRSRHGFARTGRGYSKSRPRCRGLRLSSLEPWDLQPEFFDLWPASDGRLCPHLHLPLQAGCDKTLKRMARRTRTAEFRQLLAEAHSRIPYLVVTTDMIVGFPGETQVDFRREFAFCRRDAVRPCPRLSLLGTRGHARPASVARFPLPSAGNASMQWKRWLAPQARPCVAVSWEQSVRFSGKPSTILPMEPACCGAA